MLGHLFRLMWNRKRSNLLLIFEIICSFVVLFGVGTILVRLGTNYLSPYGFDYNRVWHLEIAAGGGQTMPRQQLDEALRQVRALPGVQAAALTSGNTPFRFNTMNSNFYNGAKEAQAVDRYDAEDPYAAVMNLKIREGRWFRADDDAYTDRRPVVISRQVREALFKPGEQALGKIISNNAPGDNNYREEFLIVGVADDIRAGSDFAPAQPSTWMRLKPFDTTRWETATVLLRVSPDAGADLEQQVVKTVARATKNWMTQVRTMDEERMSKSKYTMAPVLALAVVCVFLIVNVALGLFGVLWYNINQRRGEIGVRRAMGSTGWNVSWQFLTETLILAFFGVVVGVVLAVQFPLLGAFDIPTATYAQAIGLAAVIVFFLAALCAVYPSRLAARILPARALREE